MQRGLLIASILLNALLLGFIIGDFARPIREAQGLGDLSAHYPQEIRRDLRANLIADRVRLRRGLQNFNAVRSELFEAMRAPEFDRARVESLMMEVRAETTAIQERLQAATLDAVEEAPAGMRARIGMPIVRNRLIGIGRE